MVSARNRKRRSRKKLSKTTRKSGILYVRDLSRRKRGGEGKGSRKRKLKEVIEKRSRRERIEKERGKLIGEGSDIRKQLFICLVSAFSAAERKRWKSRNKTEKNERKENGVILCFRGPSKRRGGGGKGKEGKTRKTNRWRK